MNINIGLARVDWSRSRLVGTSRARVHVAGSIKATAGELCKPGCDSIRGVEGYAENRVAR